MGKLSRKGAKWTEKFRNGKEKQQKGSKVTNCVKSSQNRPNNIEKEVKGRKSEHFRIIIRTLIVKKI